MTGKLTSLTIILLLMSCAGVEKKAVKDTDGSMNDAELYLLRKQIVAVERKNSILEEENLQNVKFLKERDALVARLQSELLSLKERYDREMKLWEQQHNNVVKQLELQEKQSTAKILELTALNKKLETELGAEIRRLNEEMNRRESERASELEKFRKDAAEKEYALTAAARENSSRMEELKTLLVEREAQVKERDKKITELRTELEKATKIREELEKSLERLRSEARESARQVEALKKESPEKP